MQEKVARYIANTLGLDEAPAVEVPAQESFGHYSSNVALILSKKEGKNPRDLALEIIEKLKSSDKAGLFEKIESAGPGFINFTLSNKALTSELSKLAPQAPIKKGKKAKVIVELISPNIAKPMHVGHGRNAIIGESVARILEKLDYKVTRWNYFGDWGTQFGKLILAYKMWGKKEKVEKEPIKELLALYTKFHAEGGEELEARAREEFKKLTEGDSENTKLWKWFTKVSLIEFEKTFKELDIKFDIQKGEGSYDKKTKALVQGLLKNGIAKESEGAIVVDLEAEGLPTALLQKSDGVSVYLTRELELLKERISKYKAKKILIVVGNEQTLHFQQLKAIAQKLGFLEGIEYTHIKYGLLLNEEGKKFSTRKGELIELSELLSQLKERTRKIVEEKNPQLSERRKDEVANVVALGAFKYNDLKERRTSDITFNWDKMLDFNGDSAPYIQYSYARLRGIAAKAGAKPSSKNLSLLTEKEELALAKKLLDFNGAILQCEKEYVTSFLASYLFDLAKTANKFYENIRISTDEDKKRKSARLFLVEKTAQTLKEGLSLLGIEVLEQI
ncbi:MAG: arginine--tRNA ligase [Candidatus Paceibacterota bacterium]